MCDEERGMRINNGHREVPVLVISGAVRYPGR